MKEFLICVLIAFFLFTNIVFGQYENCLNCVEDPNRIPIDTACCSYLIVENDFIKRKLDELNQQNDFHNTLKVIREPSTASGLITNFNWVLDGFQKKPYILDADVNFPIPIRVPIKGLYSSVQVIPKFKVRIFKNDEEFPVGIGDVSRPVRTPSAMPGIAWYFTPKSWWHKSENINSFRDKYFGIYLFHHSNGQDGIELDSINLGEINTYNGNFSENLAVELSLGGRKILPTNYSTFGNTKIPDNNLGEIIDVKYSNKRELHYKISYQYQLLTNSVFDELDTYGRHRINGNFTYIIKPRKIKYIGTGDLWCMLHSEEAFEKHRFTLNFSFIADKKYNRGSFLSPEEIEIYDISKRLNCSVNWYRVIGTSKHAATFIQVAYNGSDAYNIYFNNTTVNFRAGVAFAFFDQF